MAWLYGRLRAGFWRGGAAVLTEIIIGILALLGLIGTAWGLRQGGKNAKANIQEDDYENADDIRRRVSRDRDQRVRELDDAGWRD